MRLNYFVNAERDIRSREVKIYTHEALPDGRIRVVDNVVLRDLDVNEYRDAPLRPSMVFPVESLNAFVGELWHLGGRPEHVANFGSEERAAAAAHISSLQQEIEFLRTIVNHQLGRIA